MRREKVGIRNDSVEKISFSFPKEHDYKPVLRELSMAMAVYMLGFNTYMGFGDQIRSELGEG